MLRLSDISIVESKEALAAIPQGKVLINTINAHSYNMAQKDEAFAESLTPCLSPEDEGSIQKYLIPDGASIVKACRWLKGRSMPQERIAGWDLFAFEMERGSEDDNTNVNLDHNDNVDVKKKVMFMGSSEQVLALIKERAAKDYPNMEVVTYSPPYKEAFSDEDDRAIIKAINDANPDLLWIGMTAPKQEKWAWQHWPELDIHCHVGTIGAVFDFYAGTVKRAPEWMQRHALEWLYRLAKEPGRLWRRYLVGNPVFAWHILKEKINKRYDIHQTNTQKRE